MTAEYRHIPVMLAEVLAELDPQPGEVVCDCTLGGAGHTVELAGRVAPDGLSIGIDQDDMALQAATERLAREVPQTQTLLLKGNFGDLDELLVEAEVPGVDCFLFDLGVSSPQLDIPERGFSYHEDAPLDMRMNSGNHTLTAAEVVNTYNEADLTRILRVYGDERHAARIARRIVERRAKAPIETTLQLVDVIKEAIPAAARRTGGHPARRTFQALRIAVNGELDRLQEGLQAGFGLLKPGGRLAVITFHSLEDRIVKRQMNEWCQGCVCPKDFPVCVCGRKPQGRLVYKKGLAPGEQELQNNPRARSARLRVIEKLEQS